MQMWSWRHTDIRPSHKHVHSYPDTLTQSPPPHIHTLTHSQQLIQDTHTGHLHVLS